METKKNENGMEPVEEQKSVSPEETAAAPETEAAETELMETAETETVKMEAAQKEESAAETAEPAPAKKKPLAALRSNKFKRGGMATVLTVVFIAVVVVINVLVGLLADRFPSMNLDLTAQNLNTLSDQALEIAKSIDQETNIYLIGTEDGYRKDQYYFSSYGIRYSQVANLAEKLQEANRKITVEFVDPDTNPTFISQYSADNLGTSDVLVKTDKRYKVLTAVDMFNPYSASSSGGYRVESKVDSALAGALEMVNLDKVPVLTMATGHGEMLDGYTSEFEEMMKKENFDLQTINFLTEEIPEETQILMLPTPTTDYTEIEIEKLRAFLSGDQAEDVTLLVTLYPSQGELPNFRSFLEEWGIGVEDGVVAESDSSKILLGNSAYLMVDPSEEYLSENSYQNLVAMMTSPLTLLFEDNGDTAVRPLWTTSDSSYIVTDEMTETPEDPETRAFNVAAMATLSRTVGGDKHYSHVVVFGSSLAFMDGYISASAFGNGRYITDLLKYTTGTDGSSVSVVEETVTTSTLDVTASQSTVNLLGLGVFTIGLPVVILVTGLVIFLRRRHL